MDHTGFMRGFQSLGDLLCNRQRLIHRDRPLGDPVSQGRPFHQLQDEGSGLVALLDAVDLRDVRMVEGRQDLRFPLEPGQAIRVGGEGVRRNLQGDIAVELGVGVGA